MEIIDIDEKHKVIGSLKNVKFRFCSGFDLRILFCSIIIELFIIIAPIIVANLNNNSIIEFIVTLRYEKNGVIFAIVYSILSLIFLLITTIQIIRINFVNKGVCLEFENNKMLLIINAFLGKKYIIRGKQYIVKQKQLAKICKSKNNSLKQLISYFQKSDIYKIERGSKLIYTTKLLKVDNNWFDWFIETGVSSLPSKYVRLKFRNGNLYRGTLNGSQHQCATYFGFQKLNKNAEEFKLPDVIKSIIHNN